METQIFTAPYRFNRVKKGSENFAAVKAQFEEKGIKFETDDEGHIKRESCEIAVTAPSLEVAYAENLEFFKAAYLESIKAVEAVLEARDNGLDAVEISMEDWKKSLESKRAAAVKVDKKDIEKTIEVFFTEMPTMAQLLAQAEENEQAAAYVEKIVAALKVRFTETAVRKINLDFWKKFIVRLEEFKALEGLTEIQTVVADVWYTGLNSTIEAIEKQKEAVLDLEI